MSRVRQIAAVLILLAALATAGIALAVPSVIPAKAPIGALSEVPWLKSNLLALSFGTMLVPLGLADIRQTVPVTMRIWGILLAGSTVLWLGLVALAPFFGWSWDNCFNISFALMLLPSFASTTSILFRRISGSGRP